MNKQDAGLLVARLKACYPRQTVEKDTLAAYVRYLVDLDFDECEKAVDEWVASSPFFPAIAELRALVAEHRVGAPKPEAAWSQVLAACRDNTWPDLHPLARAAVVVVGGEWEVKHSDMPGALRRQFLDAYAQARDDTLRLVQIDPVATLTQLETGGATRPALERAT